MKANFKIYKDENESEEEVSVKGEKDLTDEEFEKKAMNVWTYRSKSKLINK